MIGIEKVRLEEDGLKKNGSERNEVGKDELENYILLLRKQRHDFMNDLQVISGYLQMKRPEGALEYIDKLAKQNIIISEIYKLQDNRFSLCLESNLKRLWLNEVKVEIDIEIDNFKSKIFEDQYNKKNNLVNTIFMELEDTNQNFIYIYIFEDELGESLLIANNESMLGELSWMEEWQQIDGDIDNLKIYKCSFDNNIAYRFIF